MTVVVVGCGVDVVAAIVGWGGDVVVVADVVVASAKN